MEIFHATSFWNSVIFNWFFPCICIFEIFVIFIKFLLFRAMCLLFKSSGKGHNLSPSFELHKRPKIMWFLRLKGELMSLSIMLFNIAKAVTLLALESCCGWQWLLVDVCASLYLVCNFILVVNMVEVESGSLWQLFKNKSGGTLIFTDRICDGRDRTVVKHGLLH